MLFVNGLPLVVIELKNPANVNADIWKAFEQLQTYKAQTPDPFQYNEVRVISDGSDARMGSLSADAERFMQWRTIVVITDRNDLDGQLFGMFSLAQDLLREQPVQASTWQDLRRLLAKRPSGGIVFATIQKFMPGGDEDVFPLLSDRHNIVVIAD